MIFGKLRILHSHGRQYIPDLSKVELTAEFRGRPVLTEDGDSRDIERAAAICPTRFDHSAVRDEVRRMFSRSLHLREVSAGGDASIEMELGATGNVNFDFGRFGVSFTASPRHADGLVLTGPITKNMAEALDICYRAIPEPKILIVCGSEACSGGLFAQSEAVDRSWLDSRRVDLWLPGAPTHPMTFIDAVTSLRKKR